MHQDNGVPSQQHRPTEETAKLENTTASNGKSSSAPSAPSSNQSSTAQSALASQTTSGSVSRDKRSLEVSRRRRQSSAKSTTSSSSSSVGKLDSSKDANQSAVGHFHIIFTFLPLRFDEVFILQSKLFNMYVKNSKKIVGKLDSSKGVVGYSHIILILFPICTVAKKTRQITICCYTTMLFDNFFMLFR